MTPTRIVIDGRVVELRADGIPVKYLSEDDYNKLSDAERANTLFVVDVKDDNDDYIVQSAEIYSLEEKRIGTWIDGKPLYRKVITSISIGTQNAWAKIGPIDNMETVIDMRGYYLTEENNTSNVFGPSPYFAFQSRKDGLYVLASNVAAVNRPLVVIVEYTKTTDEVN